MKTDLLKKGKCYSCHVCAKNFNDKSKYTRHYRTHTKEKPFVCAFCHKKFAADYNLKTHIRVHSGEKPYICGIPGCRKRFSQSSNMKVHERSHIRLDQRNFVMFEQSPMELEVSYDESVVKEKAVTDSSAMTDINSEEIKNPQKTDIFLTESDKDEDFFQLFQHSYLEF